MTPAAFVEKWGFGRTMVRIGWPEGRIVMAADLAALLVAEREQCAKIAEEYCQQHGQYTTAFEIAAAIRAGMNKEDP